MPVLVIYTASFPYGNSETFLETEISYLSFNFKEIFIIPAFGNGGKRPVPGNVEVISPLRKKRWSIFRIYLTGIFNIFGIITIPELKEAGRKIPFVKRVKYYGYAVLTKNRLKRRIPPGDCIHYSYWLDFSAFALALLRREGLIKICISRAHGYDLYDERGERSLAYIRGATLKNLDKIFFISNHGLDYLVKKYPVISAKCAVSKLGSSDPGVLNPEPGKEFLTIVSCSAINTNKRINLILDSLVIFKNRYPSLSVKWYHIGNGDKINNFSEKAGTVFKNTSVRCLFTGRLTNIEVFDFYRSTPVDFLINLSENEGIPVSIMEAHSFSIPVVATNVGGTSEIVNDENGILLQPDPDPGELADIYYNIIMNKDTWKKKRQVSRKCWEQNFNASMNYNAFSQQLLIMEKEQFHM